MCSLIALVVFVIQDCVQSTQEIAKCIHCQKKKENRTHLQLHTSPPLNLFHEPPHLGAFRVRVLPELLRHDQVCCHGCKLHAVPYWKKSMLRVSLNPVVPPAPSASQSQIVSPASLGDTTDVSKQTLGRKRLQTKPTSPRRQRSFKRVKASRSSKANPTSTVQIPTARIPGAPAMTTT